jgi:AAA domain-containing protein
VNKRAAALYMSKLFGTDRGYVAVAYKDKGESWQECQFEWPKDKTKIIGWAEVHQDANIFICPALRSDPATRKKGDMRPTKWLWADVDWDKVPADKRADVEGRINELGAYRVPSGTGKNCHVYVELTTPVTAGDHTKLNTGLRDYLYADNKQADNSLLRLPGTTNWKTEAGSPVGQIRPDTADVVPMDVGNLRELRAFQKARVIEDVDTEEWSVVDVSELPRRIMRLATMTVDEAVARYGNRHEAVWAITGELHKKGLSADQVHTLMDEFPAAVDKAQEERGYDLHKDVTKRLAHDIVNDAIFSDDDDEMDAATDESDADDYERDVEAGVQRELKRMDILSRAKRAQATRGHTEPPPERSQSLSDALSAPPDPVQWLIDGMASAQSNIILTGQYKTGKTALMLGSLIPALVDDEPFLGKFAVSVPKGGAVVGHWNLEMSPVDIIDKYMRPVGIRNTHNVHIAHWRGYGLNILTDPGKQTAVEWLTSRGVNVWTIDSYAQLARMAGINSNDNDEVYALMGAIDEIKERAGVDVCFMLGHTGRGSDDKNPGGLNPTRGASAVDEHVDARWVLTKDASDIRFLAAEGRDVTPLPPTALEFTEATKRTKMGSEQKGDIAKHGLVQAVVTVLASAGTGVGMNQTDLVKRLRASVKIGSVHAKDVIIEAEAAGYIDIRREQREAGGRAVLMHYLASGKPEGDRTRNATPSEVNLSAGKTPRRRT